MADFSLDNFTFREISNYYKKHVAIILNRTEKHTVQKNRENF